MKRLSLVVLGGLICSFFLFFPLLGEMLCSKANASNPQFTDPYLIFQLEIPLSETTGGPSTGIVPVQPDPPSFGLTTDTLTPQFAWTIPPDAHWNFFHIHGGIAVDNQGNVYVTDRGYNCIHKFRSDGTYLTTWGSNGSGDGQFEYPEGIAVDSQGNVYVADTGNDRIQKFKSDGTFLTKWSSVGQGNGQFIHPRGIAVDSQGNVYVADTGNHRIQKFRSDGTFLTKWGSKGQGDGQFNYPQGIAVDSQGNVYVVLTTGHIFII